MYPFRNILFPTDFPSRAQAALKYAAAFAREGSGEVVLFSVQNSKVSSELLRLPLKALPEPENEWLTQLRNGIEQLLADPHLAGVPIQPVIVDGDPVQRITQAAIDYGSDLITVVTQGRRGLSRAFASSRAEEIIAEAPCPVLALRPSQRDFVINHHQGTRIKLTRIIVATNFRPSSAAATQVAMQLAKHQSAELHVVYVIGDYFEQISSLFPEGGLAALTKLRSNIQERMSQIAASGQSPIVTHIAEGRPYEEIIRRASDIDAELIVIGTAVHNSLFGGSRVLGSEIERVIRNAPCPVLCVPAARVLTPLPSFVAQPA